MGVDARGEQLLEGSQGASNLLGGSQLAETEPLGFLSQDTGRHAINCHRQIRLLLGLPPNEVIYADDADKLIVDYSHGMRKKTALAAAIIHAPRVLFLDEPFEGIDAISGRIIRDVLGRLREHGTTIFFSSHILEVVERLCTRVAVIDDGRLVAQGSMEELRRQAETGDETTLEELFLRAVGASNDLEAEGRLSWLR